MSVFRAFIAWWKPRRTFKRIREQISENPRRSRGFSPAREFLQTLPRFSRGYGGTDMFYFFYKIIFIVNKEKDDIRSVYCIFSQLGDRKTKLLTPLSCFITLWKHTCRPIKTHVLSKLFYKKKYFFPRGDKLHMSKPTCNILCILQTLLLYL